MTNCDNRYITYYGSDAHSDPMMVSLIREDVPSDWYLYTVMVQVLSSFEDHLDQL